MKYILLISFITINIYALRGQQVFNKQQLIEDLKLFRNIAVKTNPSITRNGRDSMDKMLAKAIKFFPNENGTAIDLGNYISNLNLKSGYDAHANFSLDTSAIPHGHSYFPIPVIIIDENIIVNSEKTNIPYGAIITSINGINADTLLQNLSNNGNKNYSHYQLTNAFPFFYLIKYGAHKKFTIQFKHGNEENKKYDCKCQQSIRNNKRSTNSNIPFV